MSLLERLKEKVHQKGATPSGGPSSTPASAVSAQTQITSSTTSTDEDTLMDGTDQTQITGGLTNHAGPSNGAGFAQNPNRG